MKIFGRKKAKQDAVARAKTAQIARFTSKCEACGGKIASGSIIYPVQAEFPDGRSAKTWVCESCGLKAPVVYS